MARESYDNGKAVKATRDAHGEWLTHPGGLTGRRKLSHIFIEDLIADWLEHGRDAIARVRSRRPDRYLQIVVSMIPKEVDVNVRDVEEMTDEEVTFELRETLLQLEANGFKLFP